MDKKPDSDGSQTAGRKPARTLPPAARRALAEAEARRQAAAGGTDDPGGAQEQKEVNGPKGPEPTRYGDWERKGIASDF